MAHAPSYFLLTLACSLGLAAAANETSADANMSLAKGNMSLPNRSYPEVSLPEWDPASPQDQALSAIRTFDLLQTQRWAVPPRVMRCPVFQAPDLTPLESNGLHISVPYDVNKMYSIVEGSRPAENMSHYHGIELVFTTSGLPTFKVRLEDNNQEVRYIAAVKTVDGKHSLWLNWNDFHGEKMIRAGIIPCKDSEPCRNITAGAISAVALLLPIGESSGRSGNITLHSLKAAVLGKSSSPAESSSGSSGGGGDAEKTTGSVQVKSSGSVQVKASSEAETVKFQDEDKALSDAADRLHHSVLAMIAALGLVHTCFF